MVLDFGGRGASLRSLDPAYTSGREVPMRNQEAITVSRIREVLEIDDEGFLKFKIDNVKYKAGYYADFRAVGARLYTRVDKRNVDAIRAAWAIHYGEWPQFPVMLKFHCGWDFRKENLQKYSDAVGANAK